MRTPHLKLVGFLLLVFVIALIYLRMPPAVPNAAPVAPPAPPAPQKESAAVPAPAPGNAPGPSSAAALAATVPAADIQKTIAENLVPGRMVFLDFAIDGAGLKLVGAQGANGRAKPAAMREGPGFITVEAFNAAGQIVFTGSVEDPTRRRIEFPASTNDGRIDSAIQTAAGGTLAVRLPGESDATRLVFSRPAANGAREALGAFNLQPAHP